MPTGAASVKIVAWNLNHKSCERRIPNDIVGLFVALDADVVLLNEFVDGPTRTQFRASLWSAGYKHQLVSETPARHNQVFAASLHPFTLARIHRSASAVRPCGFGVGVRG
jgi:hypothetical protein